MREKKKNKQKKKIVILSFLFVLLLSVMIVMIVRDHSTELIENDERIEKNKKIEKIEKVKKIEIDLGSDLIITEIASYSGNYMEDSSDEKVSDVLAIKVKNVGEKTLQYAEVVLQNKKNEAVFVFSTLKPGEDLLVLEKDRKPYIKLNSKVDVYAQKVVFFETEVSTKEDVLEIQTLDGGFNIINISEKDINGNIEVYFKNCIEGQLCGGITYRGIIEGGLKVGEVRQVMSKNFSKDETKVVFINIRKE